jgi:transcriptional regulator with XRE-family HTH domain
VTLLDSAFAPIREKEWAMPPHEIDPRMVGRRIAEARRARGKTQEQVAAFLGCSGPTYAAIEVGDQRVKPEEIAKLSAFLGRRVHELTQPESSITGLQPRLRAFAERIRGARGAALDVGISELRRLAGSDRELESLVCATEPRSDRPIPEWYEHLAVVAYDCGAIGNGDLARYLRCDIVRAREIAALTLGGRVVNSARQDSQ